MSNCEEVIQSSGVIACGASDHDMVFVHRKLSHKKCKASFIKARLFSNFDENKFIKACESLTFDNVYNTTDPDAAWCHFRTELLDICDAMAPYGSIRIRGRLPEWMTDEYMSIAKAKDKAKRKSNKSRNAVDFFIYKNLRNEANTMSANLKRDFITTSIGDNKNNVKKLWKILRKLIPSKNSSANSECEINGSSDPLHIAESFNKLFCSIGSELAEKIPDVSLDHIPEILETDSVFEFEEVSTECVMKLLKNICASKATGIDGISAKFLKLAYIPLSGPITHIINCSLRLSVVPMEWKRARVSPLFKSGDRSEMTNYKPISVLPVMGKILERIVHDQLYRYLDENNLLHPAQSGFRPGHSTVSSTVIFLNSIYSVFDKNMITGSVFLDLKKAFDTVDHTLLCHKLIKYGVVGRSNAWFRNYLENRQQVTRYKKCISSLRDINCGIPQGSILGPLLFILYINDLPSSTFSSDIGLYADDTVLYTSGSDVEEVSVKLQDDMNRVYLWMCANKLSLNVSKTKSMLFATQYFNGCVDLSINVAGEVLEQVNVFKYLGFIDNKLTFNDHIEYILKKSKQKVGFLWRVRKYLPRSIALTLYKSLVLPHFDYGDIIYGHTVQSNLQKL